ncbi:hypothetical protein TRV_05561 [Trichophyton verrucosum HKI 0517]|uniref:Uncharacterized protein n=1 Tax=Trichophyton verrucosum (strain HKI 0517) TaxID=663202 RepID=D4DEJ4_TRIVH|nr:uncharacterized protein TRV_05561 [Trichophyton verrucosum HKI 0517]EFE39718.1 hypothetical protein TRV_05561 [Trichophyton verrucosum HKI 0517]
MSVDVAAGRDGDVVVVMLEVVDVMMQARHRWSDDVEARQRIEERREKREEEEEETWEEDRKKKRRRSEDVISESESEPEAKAKSLA